MKRRHFLQTLAAIPVASYGLSWKSASAGTPFLEPAVIGSDEAFPPTTTVMRALSRDTGDGWHQWHTAPREVRQARRTGRALTPRERWLLAYSEDRFEGEERFIECGVYGSFESVRFVEGEL